MALIPGSSQTDPHYANFNPGRPLTPQEIALRASLGAAPMSSPTNNNAANYTPNNNSFDSIVSTAQKAAAPQGQVLGAATTNNTSNLGTGAANLGLAAALANADAYQKTGQDTFQTLMDSVNAFRNRSLDLKNTGDQQITNTAAGDLGSNALTAQQLAGNVNQQGGNLGLGSKLRLGQNITGNLAKTQGSTLAAKDTNLSNNLNLYNSRQDQANTQEGQANTYLEGVNNGVNQIRSGGLTDYTGTLANIVAQAQQLAALSPLNSSGLSAMTPDFSGITNTLNSVLGTTGANNPANATGTDATNLATNSTLSDYLKRFLNPNQ